ncbi:PaaI family thioesterase [Neobacillus sp. C211]|uniref:PaaI family thioesterase n=1 Tax=unclassified Neobacillus TaxID=2675272 RepID=UPI00397B2641
MKNTTNKFISKLKTMYAQSLGIQLTKFEAGFAEAMLEVQNHMVNAYRTVHGAVIYALADHAFSVACNAYGKT